MSICLLLSIRIEQAPPLVGGVIDIPLLRLMFGNVLADTENMMAVSEIFLRVGTSWIVQFALTNLEAITFIICSLYA